MDSDVRALFDSNRFRGAVFLAVLLLCVFLFAQTIKSFKEFRYVGGGVPVSNSIRVAGEGEIFAVPDIAEFTFAVVEEAETVQQAQQQEMERMTEATAYLSEEGIAEADIKTIGYDIYPKYEFISEICQPGLPCRGGRQEQVGFEVRHTKQVKVRDTAQAGALLGGIGNLGVQNVSGLSFTIDDDEAVMGQARAAAIADAREKAEVLADQLGVSLVRIVGFEESQGGMPPIPYAARDMAQEMALGMGGGDDVAVSPGQNRVVSNVHIVYEIR
jgi:uncharacterized protein YggE